MNALLQSARSGAALILIISMLTGCHSRSDSDSAAENAAEAEGVTYSEKHGLHVPLATAQFIGLAVTDVEERPLEGELRFEARVDSSARTAVESTNSRALRAVAFLPASDAALLRLNQTVQGRCQNAEVTGSIMGIDTALVPSTGWAEVALLFQAPEIQPSLAQTVSVRVPMPASEGVVTVPRSALLQTAAGWMVYTLSGDHFVRTPVHPGQMNGERAEVRDGLYAGDQVVTTPVLALWMAELQSIRGGKACADGH